MSDPEFQFIDRFFKSKTQRSDVGVSIGDDAAVLTVQQNADLVWSVDSLLSGVHFFKHDEAQSVGYRALAVNLSDLAAMGAQPCWATLALSLPTLDDAWMQGFCQGFYQLADKYEVALVGGDTTQGPLSITVNIAGQIPKGEAILRSGARPGDFIYLSGDIGAAGLALSMLAQKKSIHELDELVRALYWPTPHVELGIALRGSASAAIDISDGLAADLGHILEQSEVGATVQLADIPLSQSVEHYVRNNDDWSLPLSSGGDYQLCFTIPAEKLAAFKQRVQSSYSDLRCIGRIDKELGLRFVNADGNPLLLESRLGYQHFR